MNNIDKRDLELDYMLEPKTICEVDKRRKCDSFYVCANKKLIKQNEELKKLIRLYKDLLDIKGGKNDYNKK